MILSSPPVASPAGRSPMSTEPSGGRRPQPEPRPAPRDVFHPEFAEDLLHAALGQPRADVIVFGQRVGVEGLVVGFRGQLHQRMAREAGAHAGGRHHLGQAFAHHQILGVPFREFVHVGACHQFVPMALERPGAARLRCHAG
ncbi:hypothetical protein G6F31_018192 [Rhizopus arrhizus]|nr:hypothetical protein G6F31_018192 [Rhizopus arrhizus]